MDLAAKAAIESRQVETAGMALRMPYQNGTVLIKTSNAIGHWEWDLTKIMDQCAQ